MKSDWAFVTASHEPIKQALLPYRGKEITIPDGMCLYKPLSESDQRSTYMRRIIA